MSAWTSGAYDAAIAQHSMSFALALHHIFGYIFVQGDIVKEKLAVDKVIRTLVRSSTRKSQQQVIICWENVKRFFSVLRFSLLPSVEGDHSCDIFFHWCRVC